MVVMETKWKSATPRPGAVSMGLRLPCNKRHIARPRVTEANALVTTKNGRVKLATDRDEAGWGLTEDGCPNSEKGERHSGGRREERRGGRRKQLDPTYQPLLNLARGPIERVDRWAGRGVLPPSLVAP